MPLPTNAQTGTVVGSFIDGEGVPAVGKCIFTPSAVKLLDPTAEPVPVTVLPIKVEAVLTDGAFSKTLLSNEDADLVGGPWNWKVDFAFTGFAVPGFSFTLPVGATVDLSVISPVPAGEGGGGYSVLGVGYTKMMHVTDAEYAALLADPPPDFETTFFTTPL